MLKRTVRFPTTTRLIFPVTRNQLSIFLQQVNITNLRSEFFTFLKIQTVDFWIMTP